MSLLNAATGEATSNDPPVPEPVRALYRQPPPKFKGGVPVPPGEVYTLSCEMIAVPKARVCFAVLQPGTGYVDIGFVSEDGTAERIEGVSLEEAAAREKELRAPGPTPPAPLRDRTRVPCAGFRARLTGQTVFELADKLRRRAKADALDEPDYDDASIYLGDLERIVDAPADPSALVDVGQLATIWGVIRPNADPHPVAAYLYMRSMDKPFAVRFDLSKLDANLVGRLLSEIHDETSEEEWQCAYEQVAMEYATTYVSPSEKKEVVEATFAPIVRVGFWSRIARGIRAVGARIGGFFRSLFA